MLAVAIRDEADRDTRASAGNRERPAASEHRGKSAAGLAHADMVRVKRNGDDRGWDIDRVNTVGDVGKAIRTKEKIDRDGERRSGRSPGNRRTLGRRRDCRGVHYRQSVGRRESYVGGVTHRERDRAENLGLGAELAERDWVLARCGRDPPIERAADAVKQRRAGRRELAADDHKIGIEHAADDGENAPDGNAGVGDQTESDRVEIVRERDKLVEGDVRTVNKAKSCGERGAAGDVARQQRLPQRQI